MEIENIFSKDKTAYRAFAKVSLGRLPVLFRWKDRLLSLCLGAPVETFAGEDDRLVNKGIQVGPMHD